MADTTTQADAPAETQAGGVQVQEPELAEVRSTGAHGPSGQIDILLDSVVTISASLGTTELPIRELLQMGPGSVIALDRKVGEPVDLYIRGIHFARGQLVVVGEKLGVTIKEILAPRAADGGGA